MGIFLQNETEYDTPVWIPGVWLIELGYGLIVGAPDWYLRLEHRCSRKCQFFLDTTDWELPKTLQSARTNDCVNQF